MASYRKLPSGKWQAAVWHPSGKRYTKTDELKRVVVEWAEQKAAEIRRGDFVDPAAGRITLAEWWARWEPTRRTANATSSKRESTWRNYVEPAFGSWPLDSIQSWDVEAWAGELARKRSMRGDKPLGAEAQATAIRLLKQLLGDAVRHRLIRINPAEVVETPSAPKHVDRFLSIEEADQLLEAITKPGERAGVVRGDSRPRVPDENNRLFVQLLLEAGLRWQEAAGLHVFRVDLKRKQLTVQEVVERGRRIKKIPKSKAGQRVVPLTDELVAKLKAHIGARDGLVFTEPTRQWKGREIGGGPLDYSNWLKRVWAPAIAAAGLADPQPTPHDCRHSYGSWLAEQGVPPHEIRDLMGHGSLRAVERYVHSSSVRMQRARDALYARRAHEPPKTPKDPGLGESETGV